MIAGVLYFRPPTETQTTTSGSTTSVQTSDPLPDTLILGAIGIALVFGLLAASRGRIGLSFGGVSVDVNELIKERDEFREQRDHAEQDRERVAKERDNAVDLADSAVAAAHPDPPVVRPETIGGAVETPEPPSPAQVQLTGALRTWSRSVPLTGSDVQRLAADMETQVRETAAELDGVQVDDLNSRVIGADFVVSKGDRALVAIEARDFANVSSLDLSTALARLGEAREAIGAEFGLLVVRDTSQMVGAVGQPMTAITTLARLRDDLEALIERIERM